MRLGTRIVLALTLLSAGTLALGFVAWSGVGRDSSAIGVVSRARVAVNLNSSLHSVGRSQLAALADRESTDRLPVYQDARQRTSYWLNLYRPDAPAEVTEAVASALAAFDRVGELLSIGRYDDALRYYASTAEPRVRVALALLDRDVEPRFEGLASLLDEIVRRQSGAATIAVGGAILLAAALLIVALATARALNRSAEALTRRVRALAEGDFATDAPGAASGEFGTLATALAEAIVRGRTALTRIRDALATIASSSRQMVASAEQYAAGSHQQAAAVADISETMKRLSSAAEQIATGSIRATRAAADGRQAVDETATGVASMREAIAVAVGRGAMLRLGSEQVGAVADAISALAERTHILALNAAIEAASAGEYGRRFSIVAGQVRELAADTRRATEQVKQTVDGLRDAIASVEGSGRQAEVVAHDVDAQARRAAAAIADVVAIVEMIARATTSQHGASAELVRTMSEIADVANSSATSSRVAADGAARLDQTAAELEELIGKFRLTPLPDA